MAFVKSTHTDYLNKQTHAELLQALPSLLKYCLKLTGSRWEAEDLVQSTCLQLLGKLPLQDTAVNWEAYLIRSARNTWIDRIRRQAAGQRAASRLNVNAAYSSDKYGTDLELALSTLIHWLPPWQRTIFLLREIWQYKTSEVAELLGTTEGAVKAALSRARAALADGKERRAEAVCLPEDQESRELLKAYLSAFRRGDVQLLVELGLHDAAEPQALLPVILESSMRAGRVNSRRQQPDETRAQLAA
ncbi:RNA polymerase sigma factor [Paenibacillus medicaginis]|uniref:RNA polymerase sigma factor n=1 Tax=Paenibacillus medicaginis TaxID=1470560 RepID=A0ABV5C2B6_9BACL